MRNLVLVALLLIGPAVAAQSPALLEALSVGAYQEQDLALPPGALADVTVTVAIGGRAEVLALHPHSMLAPGFQLLVEDELGLHSVEPAPPATLRGSVQGWPLSVVAASIVDGQLTALVRLAPDQPLVGIQPLSVIDPGAPRARHVVYDARDTLPLEGVCGTPSLPGDDLGESAAPPPPGGGNKVCDIACDADVEFYNKNGSSVTQTQNDITNVLNGVETIYTNDVGIEYAITTILVRTVESDPYSTTSPSTLLNQFKNFWNANHGAITRDVAHLFTGKNLSGGVIGIANLSVICNISSAYGLSESKFTSNFTTRVGLTAHELGHNWAATHCDGEPGCNIMCSGIGGCGPVTSFSPNSKAQINNKKNSVGCLADGTPPPLPTLATIGPAAVTPLSTEEVTITGTSLNTVSEVTVGGAELTGNLFTLLSSTQISFVAPQPTALGPVPVTVTNSTGTSNALTLTYSEPSPPLLVADIIGQTGTPFTWTWAGGLNDNAYLIVALNPSTFPYAGWNILLNPLILKVANLGIDGLDSLTITMPASASGLLFWSQVLTFDPAINGASDVTNTWVVL